MSKLYLKKQVYYLNNLSEGDTVEVGQAIAVIGEGSGNASKENITTILHNKMKKQIIKRNNK